MYPGLQTFIDTQNIWRRAKGEPEYTIATLTPEIADELYQAIDCALSPENLTCDGQLNRGEVRAKMTFLHAAAADLETLGYMKPDNVWEI